MKGAKKMAKTKFRRKAMLLFFLLFLLTASMSAPSVSFASPSAHVSVQSKRRAKKKPKKKTTKKNTKKIKKTKKKTKKKNSTNFAALYGNGRPFKFKIKGKTYTGFYDAAESQKSVKLLNDYRAKHKKKKLTQTKALTKAAMTRSKEITVLFDHKRPNGKMCFSVAKEVSGENIAEGYQSAQETMNAWIHSPGHNANMLYSKFKKIGISVFVLNSPQYGTELYAVQNFGY